MVITILAILAGMVMAVLNIARRQGRIANTKATLIKVDQAVRLFRTEMRVYPWQADLGTAPDEPAAWTNDLAWRLAWNPPATGAGTSEDPDRNSYLTNFQADLAAIRRCFRFVNGCNVPPSGDRSEGSHAFRNEVQTASSRTNLMIGPGSLQDDVSNVSSYGVRWFPGTPSLGNDCTGDAQAMSSMAEEVTKLAYVAGQMPTTAPTGIDATQAEDKARFPLEDERYPAMKLSNVSPLPFRYFPYNKMGFYGNDSRGPVLTGSTAKARGWRADYLTAALRTDASAGQRLDVDASGEAIVDAWGNPLIYVCAVRPGVRGYMQALNTSIYHGSREDRYNMGPQGRTATTELASDIRTTASQPYVLEFELWSAGPDGRFDAARDAAVNRDNISLLAYTKGLQ